MQLIRLCRFSVITGTILIWIIKWGLRPYFHFDQPAKYVLGIAPNLLGSFLLPLGCYWLLRKFINLFEDVQLKAFCIICFALLVINELLQLIPFFGRTFDYNDIAASASGLLGSYFFCNKYLFKKLAMYQ
jgi:hypothetical protein